MQSAVLPHLDPSLIKYAVGPSYYARGRQYARQRAVVRMQWDRSQLTLGGTVRGNRGDLYQTTAYFSDKASLEFEDGECSCPIGYNCKHVAALALTATGKFGNPAVTPKPVTWEQSLGSLLEPAPDKLASGTPIAIEVTLSAGAAPKVLARLVRPGKHGWVGGDLSWTKLGGLHYYGEYLEPQVQVLQELYSVYRSRSTRYSYGDEKSIELSAFESPRLWTMLDEAEAVGIRLVHGKKRLGDLERYVSAELCLDVTQGNSTEALLVTPAVQVDGTAVDAAPIGFIGAEGHGLVFVDRAETEHGTNQGDWPLRLAKLDTVVSAQLQRMAVTNQHLEIPGTDLSRFRDEYYPRLRRLATVISSDDSFTPPEIPVPKLVLHAAYGADHDLDVSWDWAYEIGGAGYRDPDQEQAVLANLDLPLARFGLTSADPEPVALGGLDTMRFTTEVLPLLADRPDVVVEMHGDPADYREAGDSLQISVSTDEIAGETDWFDLGISLTVEGREIPFMGLFMALSRGESHMLLSDGAYFCLDKPELRSLRKLIEEARALQDSPSGPLRISRFQAGLWEELASLGVVDHQAKAWQKQVAGLLSIESVDSIEPPATLSAELRPYQLDGFRWLAFLWDYQLGGILADDMGLGKTLQSLALICHAKQADPGGSPFLIVAPTSVVSNWAAESERFAPGLKVVPITDTMRRRGQTLDEAVAGADVVVTSYTLFRLDFDAYTEMPWSGFILDEAQYAKNHQSKIYQCARRLPAPFKLAITGTPMENNLMELWSLLSITAPGLFPSPNRFLDYYARPIEKQADAELLPQLRRRIKPLIKRRTKGQVMADLPAKQEQVLEVDLHPRHRKIYQTHLQRERQKVLGLIDDMNKNRFTILRSLTLLRQLSLHAGLIDDKHQGLPSAKIDALVEQVGDVVSGGHRALVFSQFTGFLSTVRERLDEAGVDYCYLDGKTRNRASVLKRFKEGSAPVFLISLKAGGFGLNLTEADYCFLLDPWWNPATEAQAVDRTHRIGQTRNVMVYRLIAKDTIEEKVTALKARKAELFSSVMDDGNVFGTTLEADDVRELFA